MAAQVLVRSDRYRFDSRQGDQSWEIAVLIRELMDCDANRMEPCLFIPSIHEIALLLDRTPLEVAEALHVLETQGFNAISMDYDAPVTLGRPLEHAKR